MSVHKKNIKLLEQFEKQIVKPKPNSQETKPDTGKPRPAK